MVGPTILPRLFALRSLSSVPNPVLPPSPVLLTVFKVPNCKLCEEALHQCQQAVKLASVADPPVAVHLKQIDIHDSRNNGKWLKYMMHVPVIHINDQLWGMHRVDSVKLLSSILSQS